MHGVEITAMVASGLISLTLTIPSIKATSLELRGSCRVGQISLVVAVTTIMVTSYIYYTFRR